MWEQSLFHWLAGGTYQPEKVIFGEHMVDSTNESCILWGVGSGSGQSVTSKRALARPTSLSWELAPWRGNLTNKWRKATLGSDWRQGSRKQVWSHSHASSNCQRAFAHRLAMRSTVSVTHLMKMRRQCRALLFLCKHLNWFLQLVKFSPLFLYRDLGCD